MIKKTTLYFLSIILILSACSTSKEARKMKSSIAGDWILQTITTEGITGKIKANVFNEANYDCFIGSLWTFDANNSLGTYNIGGTKDCVAVTRYIRWSIYESAEGTKQLQFKRLDDKKNSLDNGAGYRLSITSLDSKNMQLTSSITFEGHAAAIIYSFVKQ